MFSFMGSSARLCPRPGIPVAVMAIELDGGWDQYSAGRSVSAIQNFKLPLAGDCLGRR